MFLFIKTIVVNVAMKENVAIKAETLQELRKYTVQKHGKLRGALGEEVELAIQKHIQGGVS